MRIRSQSEASEESAFLASSTLGKTVCPKIQRRLPRQRDVQQPKSLAKLRPATVPALSLVTMPIAPVRRFNAVCDLMQLIAISDKLHTIVRHVSLAPAGCVWRLLASSATLASCLDPL